MRDHISKALRRLSFIFAIAAVPAIAMNAGEVSASSAEGCVVELTGDTCCVCESNGGGTTVAGTQAQHVSCSEQEANGYLACGATWCFPDNQVKCTVIID